MAIQTFDTESGAKIVDAIADHLFWTIRELSDKQLEAVIGTAKRATTTNCSCIRYDAVKTILPLALEEKRDRSCRNK